MIWTSAVIFCLVCGEIWDQIPFFANASDVTKPRKLSISNATSAPVARVCSSCKHKFIG